MNELATIPWYGPLVQWLCTRLFIKKIAALWGLLLLACFLVEPSRFASLSSTLLLAILAYLLITAFRLWDDLADREFDRKHHAERVLVNSNPRVLALFYSLLMLLLILTTLLLFYLSSTEKTLGLLLLISVFAMIYVGLQTIKPHRTLRTVVVLLKYPALLILLSTEQTSLRSIVIATVLYALLFAYDCYDDSRNAPSL